MISEVEEIEIFKICLEYWNSLAASLYRENPFGQLQMAGLFSLSPSSRPDSSNSSPRRQFYAPVLSQVCSIYLFKLNHISCIINYFHLLYDNKFNCIDL